jgi:class 3 adenylate cyclase
VIDPEVLADARGENEWVVASIIDIRGFTSHSMEAVEAALFLKTVYGRILKQFVPKGVFAKLTGDGVLVVEPYEPGTLKAALEASIPRWLDLVIEFRTMTEKDPEIRFPVPTQLGVGVEFGAASRLISGTQTLDFFGKPLNVAARLCDLARPSGVVMSDVAALPKRLQKRFETDQVYLKGISELSRVPIWYTKDMTSIPPFAKYPLVEPDWSTVAADLPMTLLSQLAQTDTNFVVTLKERPLGDEVIIHVRYSIRGRAGFQTQLTGDDDVIYSVEAGKTRVRIRTPKLLAYLESRGVGPRAKPRVTVSFPRRPRNEDK